MKHKVLPPGYEIRAGFGLNYYRAYFGDQLIAASSDGLFVLLRIEAHNKQRKAA